VSRFQHTGKTRDGGARTRIRKNGKRTDLAAVSDRDSHHLGLRDPVAVFLVQAGGASATERIAGDAAHKGGRGRENTADVSAGRAADYPLGLTAEWREHTGYYREDPGRAHGDSESLRSSLELGI
jgi:hypothetical protein